MSQTYRLLVCALFCFACVPSGFAQAPIIKRMYDDYNGNPHNFRISGSGFDSTAQATIGGVAYPTVFKSSKLLEFQIPDTIGGEVQVRTAMGKSNKRMLTLWYVPTRCENFSIHTISYTRYQLYWRADIEDEFRMKKDTGLICFSLPNSRYHYEHYNEVGVDEVKDEKLQCVVTMNIGTMTLGTDIPFMYGPQCDQYRYPHLSFDKRLVPISELGQGEIFFLPGTSGISGEGSSEKKFVATLLRSERKILIKSSVMQPIRLYFYDVLGHTLDETSIPYPSMSGNRLDIPRNLPSSAIFYSVTQGEQVFTAYLGIAH